MKGAWSYKVRPGVKRLKPLGAPLPGVDDPIIGVPASKRAMLRAERGEFWSRLLTIKYHRNVERQDASPRRQTPWMRQGRPIGRMSRRQAMFVIVGFLLSAGLLSQLAVRRSRLDPYGLQPVVRGEGTIIRTEPVPEGGGLVGLEVTVEREKVLATEWTIPAPYWAALAVGDRLAVVYQVHPNGTALRVLECGIVALPDRIR